MIGLEAFGGQQLFQDAQLPWLPGSYSAYDYIVGALVALFIMGLANAPLPIPGTLVERLIRLLAGTNVRALSAALPAFELLRDRDPRPARQRDA